MIENTTKDQNENEVMVSKKILILQKDENNYKNKLTTSKKQLSHIASSDFTDTIRSIKKEEENENKINISIKEKEKEEESEKNFQPEENENIIEDNNKKFNDNKIINVIPDIIFSNNLQISNNINKNK